MLGTAADAPSIWRLVSRRARSILVMHEGDDDVHVYCIHSVTGDVAGLDRFATHFGRVRLHGIQVPKAEMTTHLVGSIETIAAHHVALLQVHQPRGPIHLIGWSAGAIVALEMAQRLREAGREIPVLISLDGAPCNTGAVLDRRDPRYLLRMIVNLPRWIRNDRKSSDWSWRGIMQRLSEKMAAQRGSLVLPAVDTLDNETVEDLLARPGWSPAQKAFVHTIYTAMAKYVPRPYNGRVLVFESLTQPLFHLRQVAAAWRAITPDCEIVPVHGNHSELILEPTAGLIAAEILKRLGT